MLVRIFFALLLILLTGAWYIQHSYFRITQFIDKQDTQSPFTQRRYLLIGSGQQSFKYVALGDDLTAGVGSSDITKTYPYQIAQNLAVNADTLTFINLANPGATATEVLEQQLPQALREKPQLISLQIGLNDIHNLADLAKFRETTDKILGQLSSSKARVLIINTPYVGSPKLVNFPFNVLINLKTKQINSIVEGLNRQYGLDYYNLYAKTFETLTLSSELYSEDLIHPNEKEYIYWGRLISEETSF